MNSVMSLTYAEEELNVKFTNKSQSEEINVSGFDYCQKRDKVTFNK